HDPKTIADLNQLPYVECCILETLRLQPPAVFLLNECIRDTVLDGKRIPSGTVVATLFRKAMVAESQGGKTFKYVISFRRNVGLLMMALLLTSPLYVTISHL
ncbi:hypothetical protein FOZ62_019950, partial [Perkinsus olseni]